MNEKSKLSNVINAKNGVIIQRNAGSPRQHVNTAAIQANMRAKTVRKLTTQWH